MPLNVALLQTVKQHIVADPGNLSMLNWIRHAGECGTTACIAGWIVVFSEPGESLEDREVKAIVIRAESHGDLRFANLAATRIGYPRSGANCPLFYVDDWPRDLTLRWAGAKTAADAAAAAAEAIDRFIAGNGSFRQEEAAK